MQNELETLDIVCKHFQQYKSEEMLQLKKTNRRLRSEITKLKILLIINSALLKAWLDWRRVWLDWRRVHSIGE
jgi:hypothetical protein